MGYWLAKTEPETFSIDHMKRDGVSQWDGVRNALAQQHLRQMEVGDDVLIYHTGKERAIVGVAEVVREKYLDPSDDKAKAVCVDFKYKKRFPKPVTLAEIKADARFKKMDLVRVSRLSVMPITNAHWSLLMKMTGQSESA